MHLERDLEKLRKNLLLLSSHVEEAIGNTLQYMDKQEEPTGQRIKELEAKINEMEVDIEGECLKILALHQPVAVDLRFLIVALKVNNDLERMGDQAINILNRIGETAEFSELRAKLNFSAMNDVVRQMVRASLDALVQQDVELARKVVDQDDDVDDLHAENFKVLRSFTHDHPDAIDGALSFATISSNLERIADLCTNIGEEVIFMMEGEVVRHQS
jgi:phosphate transport system protein